MRGLFCFKMTYICGTLCASGAGTSRPAGMASETDLCVVVAAPACGNLIERGKLSGTPQSEHAGGHPLSYYNPERVRYTVRRLTPTECERLMGLPDGYTKYGSDGLPISDSMRYQALGNSIVVNVLAYIMRNIVESMSCDRKELAI